MSIFRHVFLVLFLGLAFAPKSQAQLPLNMLPDEHSEIPCHLPQVAKEWIEEFSIDVNSFPAGDYLCDNNNALKRFLNILYYIELEKFTVADSKGNFKNGIVTENYREFVRNRILSVQYINSANGFQFMATNDTFGKLEVYSGLYLIPLVGQAASLIHEARHKEGYHHDLCLEGQYKNVLGCDPNYDFKGAYSVEIEYAIRAARYGANFSDKAKDIMRNILIPLRVENNFLVKPVLGDLLKAMESEYSTEDNSK
jgi:hypothetical protein